MAIYVLYYWELPEEQLRFGILSVLINTLRHSFNMRILYVSQQPQYAASSRNLSASMPPKAIGSGPVLLNIIELSQSLSSMLLLISVPLELHPSLHMKHIMPTRWAYLIAMLPIFAFRQPKSVVLSLHAC